MMTLRELLDLPDLDPSAARAAADRAEVLADLREELEAGSITVREAAEDLRAFTGTDLPSGLSEGAVRREGERRRRVEPQAWRDTLGIDGEDSLGSFVREAAVGSRGSGVIR